MPDDDQEILEVDAVCKVCGQTSNMIAWLPDTDEPSPFCLPCGVVELAETVVKVNEVPLAMLWPTLVERHRMWQANLN